MGPQDLLMQMLQGGGAMQAQQQAAPSAAQPGGGNQMVQANQQSPPLPPQQQQLLSNYNIFISQGKTLCSQIQQMGLESEAADCEALLNRLTKLKIQLQESFMESAQKSALVAMAQPPAGMQM